MRRTLWIKGGALGDFIVGLPVLAALRRAFPDGMIEAVGPERWLPLTTGWADRNWGLDSTPWSALYGDARGLERVSAGVDLAILLRPDPEGVATANLEAAGVRQVLARSPVPDGSCHVIDHLAAVLAPLGIDVPDSPEVLHPAREMPPPSVASACIHPGSGGRHKRWPPRRFRAVADALQDRGLTVRVILGPVELEQGELEHWQGTGIELVLEPSIWNLAGALARSRLFIGNDSGVGHLAAAVGCPTIALFGPTDPAVWAPRGPSVRVLRATAHPAGRTLDSMESPQVEQVLAAVDDVLSAPSRVAMRAEASSRKE